MPKIQAKAAKPYDDIEGEWSELSTRQAWAARVRNFHRKLHEWNANVYAAELLGTAVLAFVHCSTIMTSAYMKTQLLLPMVNGLAAMVLVYALGPVSGGHVNPAVSFAVGLAGKGSWSVLTKTSIFQFLGGLLGAGLAFGTFGRTLPASGSQHNSTSSTPVHSALVPFSPMDNSTLFQNMPTTNFYAPTNSVSLLMLELFYTAILCFVFLSVTMSRSNNNIREGGNQFHGLAVGMAIIAGSTATWSVSSGMFNPAITLGQEVISSNPTAFCILIMLFQCMGAWLATLVFGIVRPAEAMHLDYTKACEKPPLYERSFAEGAGIFALTFTFGVTQLRATEEQIVATASVLLAMVYAVRDISGAYFNPALTVAALCTGQDTLSCREGAVYCLSQIVFSCFAALLYTVLDGMKTFGLWPFGGPFEPFNLWQALAAEAIFTFMLAYVFLSTTTFKGMKTPFEFNQYFGVAAGFCYLVIGIAIKDVSRGICNPALAIAIDALNVIHSGRFWPSLLYTLAETVGGVVAALAFCATHITDKDKKQASLPFAAAASVRAALPLPKPSERSDTGRRGQPKQGARRAVFVHHNSASSIGTQDPEQMQLR